MKGECYRSARCAVRGAWCAGRGVRGAGCAGAVRRAQGAGRRAHRAKPRGKPTAQNPPRKTHRKQRQDSVGPVKSQRCGEEDGHLATSQRAVRAVVAAAAPPGDARRHERFDEWVKRTTDVGCPPRVYRARG